MKKSAILLALLTTLSAAPAFAFEGVPTEQGIDNALRSAEEMDGADAARRDWRDRDHRRPRRGVVCFARNIRGQTFRAFGWQPRRVQWEAVQQCRQYSRLFGFTCRALGCR